MSRRVLTHRSMFVPGELHLGPVGKCWKCGPYIKDDDQYARGREIMDEWQRRSDRRAAVGMSRRGLQAVAIAVIPGLLITIVAVVWALTIWWRS